MDNPYIADRILGTGYDLPNTDINGNLRCQ
jgi:hypothetical protein